MTGEEVTGMCAEPGCLHSALLERSEFCPVHVEYVDPEPSRPVYAAEYSPEVWA